MKVVKKTMMYLVIVLFSLIFVNGEYKTVLAIENGDTPTELINGDFETGDLTGWEVEGDAFKNVVTNRKLFWGNRPFYQQGTYHVYGYEAGEEATGEMRSHVFTLTGTGYISFLMGAGKDRQKTFVAVVDAETDFQLFKVGNPYFDNENFTINYGRVLIDASEYLGRDLYIKVVDMDNDPNDFSFINVDDFNVNYNPENFVETLAPDYSLSVDKANEWIETHKDDVNPMYRMSYHLMAPHGWINDPNGFTFYDGKAHLFYQHNPYDETWASMHWGHATTTDFIKWEHLPVALAPDTDYDYGGIYSGGAVEKDGKLYTLYTAIQPQPDGLPALQQQALAVSEDGIHFEKVGNNPVISIDQYPEGANHIDVRDPKLYEHNGKYYALIGNNYNGKGQALLYESVDLENWQFKSIVLKADDINPHFNFGINWECPDMFTVNGQDVFIASPQIMPADGPRFWNQHSTIFVLGNMDYNTGQFTPTGFDELDSGLDYYAPQTMEMPDGRRIVVAWMQDWGTTQDMFTAEYLHGWAGAMTIPREVTVRDNHLYTYPIKELENYRQNHVGYTYELFNGYKEFSGVEGNVVDLEMKIDPRNASAFGVKLFVGTNEETVVTYDVNRQMLMFDRSKSSENVYSTTFREVHVPLLSDGTLKLRILLDRSSVEIFANDGYRTMANMVYPSNGSTGIEFFANDVVNMQKLDKYDIIVD